MCKRRGTNAAKFMDEKCANGAATFGLLGKASASHVCIVEKYKYSGSIVSVTGSYYNDAVHRVSVALNAFAPIAVRVFGARSVSIQVKLMFFESLVCSRLFYNTELYVFTCSSSINALRKLNSVYMRVVRRIAGEMRHGQKICMKDTHTEYQEETHWDKEYSRLEAPSVQRDGRKRRDE